MNKSDKIILASNGLFIGLLITLIFSFLGSMAYQKKQITHLEAKQVKLEKRIDNLAQALTTKDKEIETGIRQVQDGIMLKIDWLEKKVVE
ncbi:hypothetical protein [Pseudolactococcus raffinolactis]|uniref:hypothetical protein n=1 Tax=Pseudolactococcus raffinolactis TaxID=1366 RepID=UPI001436903A|nr:hypothetical protein [Lactococcus raffinolactis]QIW51206.1 hypothetical protein GU337_04610 [Lactococcus raffinolactis]